jgi:acyl carrier protein
VALALGRVIDIGFVSENEEMQRATNHLWSRDVTPEEIFAVIESAVKEPLRKGRGGSSIVGMKEWGPEASPVYLAPLFNHYRRSALKSKSSSDNGGGGGAQIRKMLKQAQTLEDATAKICDAVLAKMSVLLMMPVEDINSNKSMSTYGMDSLVAVEMRNWLVRELDVTLPVLELLANTSLMVLAGKIVQKSKFTNASLLKAAGS